LKQKGHKSQESERPTGAGTRASNWSRREGPKNGPKEESRGSKCRRAGLARKSKGTDEAEGKQERK